jgi:mRNA interferase RelE/StbE
VEVKYEKSFAKDLKNIREKVLLKRVKDIIEEVKKAENLNEISNIKKLKGYDTFYRIKFGDYRVGFEVVDNKVIFTRFLHRKEVYRFFP